ncbi:unnamed protein product [Rotaria socialis]|uniref:Uncharacterized protein n=1 Tax=Rotaria socialis TaxID=392032 RepID=A0A820T1V1_9BILA|nr:unnamed protein product [Rotaria socialis]CAF3352155.1 unnamed protein product [Rotaria socialis]CAF3513721.1 unnamed protein product [Rotaria socialis]CAF3598764.1 unnamed protein product [Rotaria socialis]CAF4311768.1 unnamed protein product [Rotaria socialis]
MDVEMRAEVPIITQPSLIQTSRFGSLKSFFATLLTVSLTFWLIIFLIALISAIPLTQLIVGSLFKDECSINYLIPIYLIVAGVTGLVYVIISMGQACVSESGRLVLLALKVLFELFSLAWLIAGNVWVFSVQSTVQFTNHNETNTYCHPTAYNCAFITIILTYTFACCGLWIIFYEKL